ncbi:hypothetical protein ACX1DW_20775 [Stutzerimonas sp. KH-1]|jgi:hypothetical protein|uniref:hypothetical protein n=1 Tax=Stutzerimonas frequens TaxID=2968969 RepID=UPI0010607551|nr:hypothetical protein [Stutzerimonas frequens]QTF56309.1 hypothetical protein J4H94_17255 [Stutzerimonas frequens]TDL97484.1 hypothetical protein EBP26_03480 [Stutzerimonas stutzeri ATCC 17588 = LMG 11199]WCR42744.1 hypothetical protein OML25_13115 [Stutzerimonas stutzeri]
MSKHSFLAGGLALLAPLVFAQTPPPEVVSHLNGLDVEISPMGVPAKSEGVEGELLGVRAVKVMNRTGGQITCEFHVPNDARSDTSASPVFTVAPNTQRTERVPGEYSPDEPYAEITCRSSELAPTQ